jgi:ferrous iron transport protein A
LALHAEAALERRLLALGLRPGQAICLLRRGLLNGPLHIRVGTTELMLRRQEAQHIDIRPNRRPNPIRGTGA